MAFLKRLRPGIFRPDICFTINTCVTIVCRSRGGLKSNIPADQDVLAEDPHDCRNFERRMQPHAAYFGKLQLNIEGFDPPGRFYCGSAFNSPDAKGVRVHPNHSSQ